MPTLALTPTIYSYPNLTLTLTLDPNPVWLQAHADPAAAHFFMVLAVCNTVVPQVMDDGRCVYQVG